MSSFVERSLGCIRDGVRLLLFAMHKYSHKKGRTRACLGWDFVFFSWSGERAHKRSLDLYNINHNNKAVLDCYCSLDGVPNISYHITQI